MTRLNLTLSQLLSVVGKLDDSAGDDVARERFRQFIGKNVTEVGQIRDYVEECLRKSGDQYNRALQDLANHIGRSLGFEVAFGRYHGVAGQIGFDGHWQSPAGFHIVVEVKTTEVYAVKVATLVGYVDALISEKRIPDWEKALGLYVVGRPDPESRQVENAIVAEKRTHQLRIISIDSLLSLAEMMNEYDVSHEDIMAVIRPSGPKIDPVVDLMARLVAQQKGEEPPAEKQPPPEAPKKQGELAYWLSPVKSDDKESAEECVQRLVGKEHIYAYGERTPGRRHIKSGDRICFYATGKGVVAHAKVITPCERKVDRRIRQPEKYPWVFRLDDVRLYLDEPIVIDGPLRNRLDAFQDRDPEKFWGWFVQATRKITESDFMALTNQERVD